MQDSVTHPAATHSSMYISETFIQQPSAVIFGNSIKRDGVDGKLVGVTMENLQHKEHRGLLERVDLRVNGLLRSWDILLLLSYCS